MCGIFGILGREPVADKIIASLRRLEYRGYDSAGLATLESGRLTLRRAQGKLKQLEDRLSCEPLSGTIGIGLTRWATHGRPSEVNAHPHATDVVAVAHNEIGGRRAVSARDADLRHAARLRDSRAVDRVPYRNRNGHGCRPAAKPGQIRYGRIAGRLR